MTALLSVVLLVLPAWGALQGGNGIVSGVVRDATGKPQIGVRVAAQIAPPAGEVKSADVLVSIGKTDESGRYVLEIPSGRYYIIAGRVDRPTYYPEAANPTDARVFAITSGSRVDGIDFKVFALTGVVRDAAGKPQAGVRLAVIDAKANQATDCRNADGVESKTDNTGAFRLEVFPGEYFIVAMLSDRTRFYPNAENRESATSVAIQSGVTVEGLDIVVPVDNPRSRNTSDHDLYAQALENARIGCHTAARLQLQVLLQSAPDSEYAADAKYEMAESYYREGSPAALASARKEFEEYIAFFPDASRLPQARQRLLDIDAARRR